MGHGTIDSVVAVFSLQLETGQLRIHWDIILL
jgi:hypothetical protein